MSDSMPVAVRVSEVELSTSASGGSDPFHRFARCILRTDHDHPEAVALKMLNGPGQTVLGWDDAEPVGTERMHCGRRRAGLEILSFGHYCGTGHVYTIQ